MLPGLPCGGTNLFSRGFARTMCSSSTCREHSFRRGPTELYRVLYSPPPPPPLPRRSYGVTHNSVVIAPPASPPPPIPLSQRTWLAEVVQNSVAISSLPPSRPLSQTSGFCRSCTVQYSSGAPAPCKKKKKKKKERKKKKKKGFAEVLQSVFIFPYCKVHGYRGGPPPTLHTPAEYMVIAMVLHPHPTPPQSTWLSR